MRMATSGNPTSMAQIGGLYFYGEGTLNQDQAEGMKWLHRAMEAGSADAAESIANCFFSGEGVDRDYSKALEYWAKAVDLGSVKA